MGDGRPARAFRQRLGRTGEDAAIEALRARGYRIIARNVRLRGGELDVIAEDAGTIVFVEVKARRSSIFGTPVEAVGPRKQRTLCHLALRYLAGRRLEERPCRFDVVEVWVDSAGTPRAGVLQDAFRP
jgi:putative endonuclease